MVSQKIEKNSINIEAKTLWTLSKPRLCPTTGNNVLIPVRDALIARLMVAYEYDMGKFLAREMIDRVVGG